MTTNDSKIFGRKLKQLREAKNMTKSQLAKATKSSISTITNYESGYTMPTGRKLLELSCALGTNLSVINNAALAKSPIFKLSQKEFKNLTIPVYLLDNTDGFLTFESYFVDHYFNIPMCFDCDTDQLFATLIEDDSMSKSFMIPGHYAIFQYDPQPENNIIVLAYIKSENKMVIRYYSYEDGIVILTDNSYYREPEHRQYYSDDIKIIGSLVMRFVSGNH